MSTADSHPDRHYEPTKARIPDAVRNDHSLLGRWRAQKRARRLSPRKRRVFARWLRRTARDANAHDRDPIRRRYDPLLHYRAAAVRNDLLEIAALLEQAHDPDPGSIAALSDLLASCDSPLYNAEAHVSELYATLEYVRRGLAPRPQATDTRGERRLLETRG